MASSNVFCLSKMARSPPTQRASLRVRAPFGPPLTGASSRCRPRPANCWCSRKRHETAVGDDRWKEAPAVRLVARKRPSALTGAVYGLQASNSLQSRPAGQWNTFEIEATSSVINVTLNNKLVTKYVIPANTSRRAEGHIGLQCHTGNVQFRNLMIRAL